MAKKKDFLMYKGRPLVRNGKTVYYGYMSDPYVLIMQITSTRNVNGMEVADRVVVQLVNTDPTVRNGLTKYFVICCGVTCSNKNIAMIARHIGLATFSKICVPVIFSVLQTISPNSSFIFIPSFSKPFKCKSIGLAPILQPPGKCISTCLNLLNNAPIK